MKKLLLIFSQLFHGNNNFFHRLNNNQIKNQIKIFQLCPLQVSDVNASKNILLKRNKTEGPMK